MSSQNVLILNNVNLGQKPEFFSNENVTVITFSVGEDNGYYDKDNKWVERTEWHTVKAFGKHAESLVDRFNVGDTFWIDGSLSYQRQEQMIVKKDGEHKSIKVKNAYLNINQIKRIKLGKISKDLRASQNDGLNNAAPQHQPNQQAPAQQQAQAAS